MKVSAIDVRAD
jgi:hypothetical protein